MTFKKQGVKPTGVIEKVGTVETPAPRPQKEVVADIKWKPEQKKEKPRG